MERFGRSGVDPAAVGVVAMPAFVALAATTLALLGVASLQSWCAAFTAAAASAVAGMLVARRASAPEDRSRWTWWAAGAGAWLVGQLGWDVYALAGSSVAARLADLGYHAFALLIIGGLLRTRDGSRTLRLLAALEVVPLIAAAMTLPAAWLWDEAVASLLAPPARLAALMYPAVYVAAAVVTLQAIVGGSLRRVSGHGPRVVLAGTALQATAFISWSEQLLQDRYVTGASPVDFLWVLGLLAMATGGLLAARSAPSAPAVQDAERWGAVLPGITFALLLGALIRETAGAGELGPQVTLAAGLGICGATLALRGTLLQRRLRVLLARERIARHELADSKAALAQVNDRLRQDVRRDPLTGLHNRRALTEDLADVEALARRHGESFALALCDVDHFKAYNDELGHLAGDDALRELAAVVRRVLRAGDVAYRYGGEELLLVLRSTDAAGAVRSAERVRAAVAAAALPHPVAPAGIVTVSLGIAAGDPRAATLMAFADAALYEAKRAGRNRVALSDGASVEHAVAGSPGVVDEPLLRHLRSMLGVSRAATGGRGATPVLEAIAETLRSELRFQTVAVNLRDPVEDLLRVVLVAGDEETREALEGTSSPWSAWQPVVESAVERNGALWIPAGSHEWAQDIASWTPAAGAALGPDAWDPDDMLLLPMRGADGALLGLISVDEPLGGRRPDDGQLGLLMAVVDHGSLAFEHAQQVSRGSGDAGGSRLAAVMLLAETLDLRDSGTAAHSRTVGTLANRTAAALGLAPDRVRRLHAAGVLHDLGKLGVSDATLHKAGPLDDTEWREMRRHPEIGARILEHAGLRDIATWVRAHHERIDGRGYPDGLRGEAIPLEARILAIADAYEAMIADRPYRAGMPVEEARLELRRCAGSQFDERVVDAFLVAAHEAAMPQPA